MIQEEEYPVLFGPEPGFGVDPTSFSELNTDRVMKLQGEHDLFGDQSLLLIPIPGHTPGHQVLYVDLPESGPIVLSGDLYHFEDNRTHKRVPSFNFDADMTRASMDKLEAFLVEKSATLWIQHDADQYESLPHAPNHVR